MEEENKKSDKENGIVLRNHIGSEERLMAAMEKNRGVMAYAAADLGVSRQAVWEYIERRPHLKPLIHDMSETQVDRSEAQLFKQIDKGDVRAIVFHLRTKGKDRGYVERTEMVGDKGGPIQIAAVPVQLKPVDRELEAIDETMLSRDEQKELATLVVEVDTVGGAFTALPPPRRERFLQLVDKGRPKKAEAE